MEKTISKRAKIRLAAYLVFVIAVLSIFAISGAVRVRQKEAQLRVVSSRALADLDTYVQNMQVNLEKGLYTGTTPMLSKLSVELWRDAAGAKQSLSALPVSANQLSGVYKFLSQLGDFVMALEAKELRGDTISPEERAEVLALLDYCRSLSKDVCALREGVRNGEIDLEAKASTLQPPEDAKAQLSDKLADTEQSFVGYPTLIYDGPFSDHMSNREPVFLKNKEEISKEDAEKRAMNILGVPKEKLKFMSTEDDMGGNYRFYDGERSIAITKRGGYLLYMLSSKFVGEEKLDAKEGQAAAKKFLKENGFDGMQETYHAVEDGICTYNFAYTDTDYVFYPDLIKVSVSLESGEILSADCRGYILNHQAVRNLPSPKLSASAAQNKLSPFVEVLDCRLAVIPQKSGVEVPAYEFHCKNEDGQEMLIYVGTQSGVEEDILWLLYTDDGVLTK